jgi:signal transduction histidine kinase
MSSTDFKLNMNEDILSKSEVEILKLAKRNSSELVKLKSEEKFRREFIGNLAHELKTPIFSIQGYIGVFNSWVKITYEFPSKLFFRLKFYQF